MKIKSIIKNILMLSGILFWITIIISLYIPPPNLLPSSGIDVFFWTLIYWLGLNFWLIDVPFELIILSLLILMLIITILLEKRKQIKNGDSK